MKKILTFIALSLFVLSANSQQLYLEMGKTHTKFDYQNTDGSGLKGVVNKTDNFMALGYSHAIAKSRWSAFGGLNYNTYSATSSDALLDNYFEWNFTYLGVNAGMGYEIFKPKDMACDWKGFTVKLKGGMGAEFMLEGSQIVNLRVTDLKEIAPYDAPVYYLRGGVQVNYYLSKKLVLFGQYTYSQSLRLEEILYGPLVYHEELKFNSQSFGFGVTYSIF